MTSHHLHQCWRIRIVDLTIENISTPNAALFIEIICKYHHRKMGAIFSQALYAFLKITNCSTLQNTAKLYLRHHHGRIVKRLKLIIATLDNIYINSYYQRKLLSTLSNLHTTLCPYFKQMHRQTGCKGVIHDPKHHRNNQSQSLEHLLQNILIGNINTGHGNLIITSSTLYARRMCRCQTADTLTHWGRDKWPPFSRRHFQMHFLEWKCIHFD